MQKNGIKKALIGTLAATTLCSCATVECDNPNNHIHKYKGRGLTIDVWSESHKEEVEAYGFYKRTDEMINITSEDEKYYRFLNDNKITRLDVDSGLNMNYLYNQIYSYSHDVLEFYYYSEEEIEEEKTDENGKKYIEKTVKVDEGYSTNPYHHDNTGKVRITHTMFLLSKVIYKNGKWTLDTIKVDDPQEYWNEYNYFKIPTWIDNQNNLTYDRVEYYYGVYQLPFLNVDEITPFTNVDTTTEGYRKWYSENKTSFIESDGITLSLSPKTSK